MPATVLTTQPGERYTRKFARGLLEGLRDELNRRAVEVRAVLLTLIGTPKPQRAEIERFCLTDTYFGSHRLPRGAGSACLSAITRGEVLVYPPGDAKRSEDTTAVAAEIEAIAASLEDGGAAKALRGLASHARGDDNSSSLIVLPAVLPAIREERIDAALSIVIAGENYFAPSRRRLLLELGSLVASGLEEARAMEVRWLAERLEQAGNWRANIEKTATVDDLFAAVINGVESISLPSDDDSQCALGAAGIVWLLSRDRSELSPRVTWGERRLPGGLLPIAPRDHPTFASLLPFIKAPKGPLRLECSSLPITLDLRGDSGPLAEALGGLGRWMTSIPLVGAQNELIGTLDLFRHAPLVPEIDEPLAGLARRLGRQVVSVVDRSHLRSWAEHARKLHRAAPPLLKGYRLTELWQLLARTCREALRCSDLDLYYDLDGKIAMRSTTRPVDLQAGRVGEMHIRPRKGREPLGNALFTLRPTIAHSSEHLTASDLEHVSTSLQERWPDGASDRLIVPLPDEGGSGASGAIVAYGPFVHGVAHEGAQLSERAWSACPDELDLQLSRGLARVIERIARMARVVEEQSALVDEMVHELAHPLNSLRGHTAEAIEMYVPEARQREVKRQLDGDYALFEDSRDQLGCLADLARADRGSSVETERCDLGPLVRDCCRTWEREAGRRSVQILGDRKRGLWVSGNRRRLRQAISNLIHNAVKYSFAGRDVTATLRAEDGTVVFKVTNHGVGIPKEDRDRVYDLYFRSNVPDLWKGRKGMGVGLPVVRDAVQREGGSVRFTSVPRDGRAVGQSAGDIENIEHTTVFTITLPALVLMEESHGRNQDGNPRRG